MIMSFLSKRISLFILGITALFCSRAMFLFLDDPEGPNLLIVFVMAIALYVPSFIVFSRYSDRKAVNFLLAFLVQIVEMICLSLLLK